MTDVAGNRPLDAGDAHHFRHALQALQSGRAVEALAVAEALVARAPRAADAWQLLGMCLAGSGRDARSDAAFEHALALQPGSPVVSRNYGVALARRGKILREQDRPDESEPVLHKALGLYPDHAAAWVDLGVVLRLLGRIDEALAAFRSAQDLLHRRGNASPEVEDAITGVLADAGRPAEALQNARRLVARYPAHAPAHETLGNLLWEYGADLAPDEEPLAPLRAAARAQPGNRALLLALARMLRASGRADEALALLQPLRRRDPGDGVLTWFYADALDALGQGDDATSAYEAAARTGLADVPDFLNAQARHALRTQRLALATACAQRAVTLDPRNQEGWSLLGTAWRLADDPREHWLFDYERLVGVVEIAPPAGYADLASFLRVLEVALDAMHGASREPVHQSVRGGTQTAGQLFGRGDRVIREAEVALCTAVDRWLATLPDDPTHPFLARKRRSVAFVGSWSVKLASSGRHSNHVHPRGWMSSAFYVAVPDSVLAADEASRAGWLQFGQPLDELGLDLPPRRVLRPRPGHLALFPSFMWHGTVPFAAPCSRLTMAFDMQPRDGATHRQTGHT